MRVRHLHAWDLTVPEARDLQRQLAVRVDIRTPLTTWDTVVGADVSYNRFSNVIHAAAVVWRASTGVVVETRSSVRETAFPYRSGFLSFREAPALLDALKQVQTPADVVMLDGQGVAHPRRLGLACHIGLWLDVPTVGAAKSRLTGQFEEPGIEAGDRSPLVLDGETVGAVVRSKRRSSPLFVSPGHGIDVESAVRLVLGCVRRYRMPEPTRLAHEAVNAARRAYQPGESPEKST
jgi:deoxyribonuclease V